MGNMFQGEMDPEIAALLGGGSAPATTSDYSSAILGDPFDMDDEKQEEEEVDLTAGSFPEVTKRFESAPNPIFSDPNFYKAALSGEGDSAQRVHNILQKYVGTKDPKDKGVYRQQVTTAFWDFMVNVARKAAGKLPDHKKYLLRFFMLHPTFLTNDHRDLFSKFVVENELNQPVYYLDEWYKAVGTGTIRNSATDEVRIAKNSASVTLQQLLDKAAGKRDGARSLLKAKDSERLNMERYLVDKVKSVTEHYPLTGFSDINACYTEPQKKQFADIQELIKNILKADRDLEMFIRDFYQAEEDVKTLEA
jgi:hypothetical protein